MFSNQIALAIRNGNVKTAPINLNTNSIVKPTIRKGSKINHSSGKRIKIISASGQQITNSKHQRTKAINVFMPNLLAIYKPDL